MSDLNASELDRIERETYAEPDFKLDMDDSNCVMAREDVRALVAALRTAWRDFSGQFAASEVYRKRLEECRAETEQLEAERGRVVGVTRHRDVTLTTYERANASDEATGEGG